MALEINKSPQSALITLTSNSAAGASNSNLINTLSNLIGTQASPPNGGVNSSGAPVAANAGISSEAQAEALDNQLIFTLGQNLKAVVVSGLNQNTNQILLNINGQTVKANTSAPFTPGDILNVKVTASSETQVELQVQSQKIPISTDQQSVLQNTLLQVLPKQAPATSLLDNLAQLSQSGKLPAGVTQQIQQLLSTIVPLSQLPQQLTKAIQQSGVFLESTLLDEQKGTINTSISADVKGQYLRLFDSLPAAAPTPNQQNNPYLTNGVNNNAQIKQDSLPLPGATPQPLHKTDEANLQHQSAADLQQGLRDQVSQVLARITGSQINHVMDNNNKEGYFIMLDLPIKTAKEIDVIPLQIEEQKATPAQPQKWSISFAVSLSNLGDMQATVSLNGDNLDVRINVQQPETIGILNAHQSDMANFLEELGLKLRNFNLKQGLDENKIDTQNIQLLDIRI